MKNILSLLTFFFLTIGIYAQKSISVPSVVKTSLTTKYPEAQNVTWEREKGNFEANWGGKSGEDNSVQFTPTGAFVNIVRAISINDLPSSILPYIKSHYLGAVIKEAGKVTDDKGTETYEIEIKGKDLIFDHNGKYQPKK